MGSYSFSTVIDFLDNEHLQMAQEMISRYCFFLFKNEKPTETLYKLTAEIRTMNDKNTIYFLDDLFAKSLSSQQCLAEVAKLIANIPISKKDKNNLELINLINTIKTNTQNEILSDSDNNIGAILLLEDIVELALYATRPYPTVSLKSSTNLENLQKLTDRIGPKKYFKTLEDGIIQKVSKNDGAKKALDVAEKVVDINGKKAINGMLLEGAKQLGVVAKDINDSSIRDSELRLLSIIIVYFIYCRILQSRNLIFTGANHG